MFQHTLAIQRVSMYTVYYLIHLGDSSNVLLFLVLFTLQDTIFVNKSKGIVICCESKPNNLFPSVVTCPRQCKYIPAKAKVAAVPIERVAARKYCIIGYMIFLFFVRKKPSMCKEGKDRTGMQKSLFLFFTCLGKAYVKLSYVQLLKGVKISPPPPPPLLQTPLPPPPNTWNNFFFFFAG